MATNWLDMLRMLKARSQLTITWAIMMKMTRLRTTSTNCRSPNSIGQSLFRDPLYIMGPNPKGNGCGTGRSRQGKKARPGLSGGKGLCKSSSGTQHTKSRTGQPMHAACQFEDWWNGCDFSQYVGFGAGPALHFARQEIAECKSGAVLLALGNRVGRGGGASGL